MNKVWKVSQADDRAQKGEGPEDMKFTGAHDLGDEERRAQYFFHLIKGMTPKRMERIRAFSGSFKAALGLSSKEIMRAGGFREEGEGIYIEKAFSDMDKIFEDYEGLSESGIRYVSAYEKAYPGRLLSIPQRPVGLFVKGELPKEELPSAAVIGARACSEYGKDVAHMFGERLASAGVQVISGMAAGIDSHAQRGAVKAGKPTFSVLGCGVNICYPKENYYLYRRILDLGGGIISEYPPDCPPYAKHFPMRNRIIAGLGDCLMVLEARERSGTSITVDFALEQGKEVFALPGRITDPLGKGCNELIKSGAAVLTEPRDVLDFLKVSPPSKKSETTNNKGSLAKNEKTVYAVLDSEEKHVEEIACAAGLSIASTMEMLLALEMKGLIRETRGACYMKIGDTL